MNKNMILMGLVVTIVVFAGAGCQKQAEQVEAPDGMPVQVQEQEMAQKQEMHQELEREGEVSFMGGMKGLLTLGGAQKCTWESGDGETGTIYTDGMRLRAESRNVRAEGDGPAQDITMIQDGEDMYTWNVTTKQGQKLSMQEMEKMASQFANQAGELDRIPSQTNMPSQELMDEEHDFSCVRWNVDEKMFTPPADITFEDMHQILEQAQGVLQNMAGACDELTGAQKAACEGAMKQFGQQQ